MGPVVSHPCSSHLGESESLGLRPSRLGLVPRNHWVGTKNISGSFGTFARLSAHVGRRYDPVAVRSSDAAEPQNFNSYEDHYIGDNHFSFQTRSPG